MSGRIDTYWRKRLVHAVASEPQKEVLDVATGSGDVAFALARGLPTGTSVVGVDFCAPMIVEAQEKARKRASGSVRFLVGDALQLPFSDAVYDTVTLAFGLRNMENRDRCLREALRVLKPGGRIFVLEFSKPRRWLAPLYAFYLHRVCPLVAGLLTGEPSAYEYLGASIEAFPDPETLCGEFRAAGFAEVSAVALTGGIVALHQGRRPL